ncbi:MAG: hypothetical protein AABZ60_06025, partial [Planctomycetota bacterium]
QISFKNKKGTLVSGSIQTNQPLYLSDPPCYLDLGVLPKLPNLEPLPPKKSLSTSPLLWQLTQPGIRYQSLLAPETPASTPSPFLMGTLDTFFLDRPGSIKLKLQRVSPLGETLPNTRLTVTLKTPQILPEESLLWEYPFQGETFREEILIPTRGFHQLEVTLGSLKMIFPIWVESGPLLPETPREARFFAQRLPNNEAFVFLQSGYPGNYLLNLEGEQSLPILLSQSGFRVLRIALPETVSSMTLFSPFSKPLTLPLPKITNLSQKFSEETKVWRLKTLDFRALSFAPGWSRTLSSEVPWKNHLPYPKKEEEFREKYQNSLLLESSSLMEKFSYTHAVESLRQARIVLPKQGSLEKLHASALESLLAEHQMQNLVSQKLTLSIQDQPFHELLSQISTQTGIPLETNAPLEKIRFSCHEQTLLQVLAQISIERDLQIQVDFGSLSFQRSTSMLEFPVSAFSQETLFQPDISSLGSIAENLSFTPEFFICAQPQTLSYGFVCKLSILK